jgi:hypothetical protein
MTSGHMIFGSPNGETDELLSDCFVATQLDYEAKPILIGKWGLGKTAILFERNKELRKALANYGYKKKRIWYMSESSFDIAQILELRKHYSGEKYVLELALTRLWTAEITRAIINQIAILSEYYGSPTGKHWQFIRSIRTVEPLTRPLWKGLSDFMSVVVSERISAAIDKTKVSVESLFQEYAYDQMQECLEDIKDNPVQPVVVIEPIETPDSPLEKQQGIAQLTINALLSACQMHFELSDSQKARVMLSIPWHRYKAGDLAFPQKLHDYKRTITWKENCLRDFLNRRIEWEFKRVGRHYSGKAVDPFDTLFESNIRNDYCHSPYQEETFKYLLRHTHYRARDLQRLARAIVAQEALNLATHPDEIIKGKGGKKISPGSIKDAIRVESRALFHERMIEGGRRYPDLKSIVTRMEGLAVPFDESELRKRFPDNVEYNEAIQILWEIGFLGVSLTPRNEQIAIAEHYILGGDALRKYDIGGSAKIQKWFFFEHLTGRSFALLADKYRDSEDVQMKLVLHPSMFDAINLTIGKECPLGA